MRAPALKPLLAAAASLVIAACSSSGSSGEHASDATHLRLIKKAHLDRCPASMPTPVKGGLPDVTLTCLGDGPAVHLGGLTGTPTVVNVWGSWCIPCQREAPALSTVYDALRPKVRFLGIDTEDEPDSALDFGAHVEPPVRYPSVVDPDKKVIIGLAKAPGPPETAFVDASGMVVHVHTGGYDSAAQLRADIATYLRVR